MGIRNQRLQERSSTGRAGRDEAVLQQSPFNWACRTQSGNDPKQEKAPSSICGKIGTNDIQAEFEEDTRKVTGEAKLIRAVNSDDMRIMSPISNVVADLKRDNLDRKSVV